MSPQADELLEAGHPSIPEIRSGLWKHTVVSWLSTAFRTSQKIWQPLIRVESRKLRPTAYLDGMRGFSALLVYILHNEVWAHDSLQSDKIFENGFGHNKQYYFACLPGVRILFSGGHFSVAIFFVVSGYVLSLKPLQLLLVQDDHHQFMSNIASALFRRWIRLFIPLIATTFIYMTLNYLIPDLSMTKPEAKYHDELFKWYAEFKDFSFVFRMGGEPWFSFNFHSWTIPLEFKGSIVIYTALIAFVRCKTHARLWCQIGLIWYFLYVVDGWYCACFVTGMLLCELDIRSSFAPNTLPGILRKAEPSKNSICIVLFMVGIYLAGVPAYSLDVANVRDAPGWYYLSFLKPQATLMPKAFFLYWAATFITIAVPRIALLRAFFECRFNQYLGKVSYGFYLVHGPVLWTIGNRVYAAVGWTRAGHAMSGSGWVNAFPLPKVGPLGLEFNFVAAQVILLPMTLWAAKLVTSCIDEPSIRLSRWAYGLVVDEIEDPRKMLK